MLEPIMNNLHILMPALWSGFAVYSVWYVSRAKHYSPITNVDARTLWYIHHKTLRCHGRRWRKITRKGQLVGFQCDCGYKHMQKRPLVSHSPAPGINTHSNPFDKSPTSRR